MNCSRRHRKTFDRYLFLLPTAPSILPRQATLLPLFRKLIEERRLVSRRYRGRNPPILLTNRQDPRCERCYSDKILRPFYSCAVLCRVVLPSPIMPHGGRAHMPSRPGILRLLLSRDSGEFLRREAVYCEIYA
jgi:hypothetical protein